MSIKINRLEEGHNSMAQNLLCWATIPHTCIFLTKFKKVKHATPRNKWSVCWSSSSITNTCMWNCSPTQQILSHSFNDWKLCELFLLSGFLICHAVGWYIELKNQMFWWRIPARKIFQNPHVIYATTRVNSFTIFLLSLFYCRQNLSNLLIFQLYIPP
jgi:hypothetical protein